MDFKDSDARIFRWLLFRIFRWLLFTLLAAFYITMGRSPGLLGHFALLRRPLSLRLFRLLRQLTLPFRFFFRLFRILTLLLRQFLRLFFWLSFFTFLFFTVFWFLDFYFWFDIVFIFFWLYFFLRRLFFNYLSLNWSINPYPGHILLFHAFKVFYCVGFSF